MFFLFSTPFLGKYLKDAKLDLKELDKRWISLRLLDGDEDFFTGLKDYLGYDLRENDFINNAIKKVTIILKNRLTVCIKWFTIALCKHNGEDGDLHNDE